MIKKFTALIMVLLMLFGFTSVISAEPITVPADISTVGTKNVLLYETNSKTVLYGKNEDKTAFPASTTKVLTAIIVIDLCEGTSLLGDINSYFKDDNSWISPDYSAKTFSLDEKITVENPETRGSCLGVYNGEVLTVRELLHGMMLVSGNDCARALALHFSPDGRIPGFSKLMNAYAIELGGKTSNFVVPHGLHDDNHTTTAYDMALVTAYALKNSTFREIVASETYTIAPTNKHSEGFAIENSNRLVHRKTDDDTDYTYEYAIGVKTGDTDAAGRCIIAAAEKNGMQLIAVLFGDYENSRIGYPRYVTSKALFEFGFNNFTLVKASELGIESQVSCNVKGAEKGNTTLKVDIENAVCCVPTNQIDAIRQNAKSFQFDIDFNNGQDNLTAPVKSGETVGLIKYSYGDFAAYNKNVVLTANLIATENIQQSEDLSGYPGESSGVRIEEEPDNSYNWIFYLLLTCTILIIIIVIVLIVKQPVRRRKNQLRRRRRSRRF